MHLAAFPGRAETAPPAGGRSERKGGEQEIDGWMGELVNERGRPAIFKRGFVIGKSESAPDTEKSRIH